MDCRHGSLVHKVHKFCFFSSPLLSHWRTCDCKAGGPECFFITHGLSCEPAELYGWCRIWQDTRAYSSTWPFPWQFSCNLSWQAFAVPRYLQWHRHSEVVATNSSARGMCAACGFQTLCTIPRLTKFAGTRDGWHAEQL